MSDVPLTKHQQTFFQLFPNPVKIDKGLTAGGFTMKNILKETFILCLLLKKKQTHIKKKKKQKKKNPTN